MNVVWISYNAYDELIKKRCFVFYTYYYLNHAINSLYFFSLSLQEKEVKDEFIGSFYTHSDHCGFHFWTIQGFSQRVDIVGGCGFGYLWRKILLSMVGECACEKFRFFGENSTADCLFSFVHCHCSWPFVFIQNRRQIVWIRVGGGVE